jgi:hypothetical protein
MDGLDYHRQAGINLARVNGSRKMDKEIYSTGRKTSERNRPPAATVSIVCTRATGTKSPLCAIQVRFRRIVA